MFYDAGASLTHQASQREEEKRQLEDDSIQILKHCNLAAQNINVLM
jgi:hypothetical protein